MDAKKETKHRGRKKGSKNKNTRQNDDYIQRADQVTDTEMITEETEPILGPGENYYPRENILEESPNKLNQRYDDWYDHYLIGECGKSCFDEMGLCSITGCPVHLIQTSFQTIDEQFDQFHTIDTRPEFKIKYYDFYDKQRRESIQILLDENRETLERKNQQYLQTQKLKDELTTIDNKIDSLDDKAGKKMNEIKKYLQEINNHLVANKPQDLSKPLEEIGSKIDHLNAKMKTSEIEKSWAKFMQDNWNNEPPKDPKPNLQTNKNTQIIEKGDRIFKVTTNPTVDENFVYNTDFVEEVREFKNGNCGEFFITWKAGRDLEEWDTYKKTQHLS